MIERNRRRASDRGRDSDRERGRPRNHGGYLDPRRDNRRDLRDRDWADPDPNGRDSRDRGNRRGGGDYKAGHERGYGNQKSYNGHNGYPPSPRSLDNERGGHR